MKDASRAWGPVDEEDWILGAEDLQPEQRGGQVWLVGPCPGCGHNLSRNITAGLGVALVEGAKPRRFSIRCNCGKPHVGRAADAQPAGCGAAGVVQLETE